MDWG
jgi:hypothetical protein